MIESLSHLETSFGFFRAEAAAFVVVGELEGEAPFGAGGFSAADFFDDMWFEKQLKRERENDERCLVERLKGRHS